jgi:drug/metabolite transporter (DMT)-like permease
VKIRVTRTDLLLIYVLVAWATTFSAAKYGLREIGPLAFAALRFLAAAIMLLIWVWAVEGKPTIKRQDWVSVALVGLTAIGVYQIFFSTGLKYTTASNSSLLIGTAPIWTAIMAAASRQERITAVQAVGILLSFVGVAIFLKAGSGNLSLDWDSLRGDLLTMVAAVLTATSAILSKRPLQRYSALRVMTISMVCGSLFLVPFAWPQLTSEQWSQVSTGAWLALAYSTIIGGTVAYVIWYKSIGEIGATRTVVYNTLIPPMAVVTGVVALGERFSPLQVVGAVIILGGVALTRFAPAKKE